MIIRRLGEKISYSIRAIVQVFASDEEAGRYADHRVKVERAGLVEGDEVEKVVKRHGGGSDLTAPRCFGGHLRSDFACVLLLHAGRADLEVTAARAPWGKCVGRAGVWTSGALLSEGLTKVCGDVEDVLRWRGGGGRWRRECESGGKGERKSDIPCMESLVLLFLIPFLWRNRDFIASRDYVTPSLLPEQHHSTRPSVLSSAHICHAHPSLHPSQAPQRPLPPRRDTLPPDDIDHGVHRLDRITRLLAI